MLARLNIEYLKNEIAPNNACSSELIDMEIACRIEVGDTFFFTMYGFEWMGKCTSIHHLFFGDLVRQKKLAQGAVLKENAKHIPMFTLEATAVRKIPRLTN